MSNKLQNFVRGRLAEMGKNPFELAREFDFERNYINEIVTGRKNSIRSSAMPKLAKALGVSLDTFIRATAEEVAPANISRTVQSRPPLQEVELSDQPYPYREEMPRNLPVYGTAAASLIGTFESFNLETAEPIDYVRRPPALLHIKTAYAFTVLGESMWPAHPSGHLRFANPNRMPRSGDTVILQTKNHEHDVLRCYIKTLVKAVPEMIRVEQFNPSATMDFKRETVLAMHYVMTMNDLFGL